MEKFLEPIELNDTEIAAVSGGATIINKNNNVKQKEQNKNGSGYSNGIFINDGSSDNIDNILEDVILEDVLSGF
jgi:hypothetical protein